MTGEFLLELLSEEIPARMQARAAEDLARLVADGLAAQGLKPAETRAFATPRRLVLCLTGLPSAQPDVTEERRGPKVGAPAQALEGFLKANGAALADLAERDTPKGKFHFLDIHRTGRPTAAVLADILAEALPRFPWPKSMRWGERSERWVRPLEGILCLFEGQVVPLAFAGREAGNVTKGHRFLAPDAFTVADFADYAAKLEAAKVMLDPVRRRDLIAAQAESLAAARGLAVLPDAGLLAEVAGLVECPNVLIGRIDDAFMAVPREVLSTSMRTHQKYFSLTDASGALAPFFLVVSNMETADAGATIAAGNERVLRARLSDARFFWDSDRAATLESRIPALADRIFHAALGSVLDKAERIAALAARIAPAIGADADKAARAARLAKADLSTEMVGEFPELQGVMGRYYALHDGEDATVAAAVADHYAPQGPSDACPSAPVSVAVALADKIDSLTGFFAIDEKPTGSRDPYALRRAALGIVRLVLENRLRLPLKPLFAAAHGLYAVPGLRPAETVADELIDFLADRLKVHLREQGVGHDVIAAVFAKDRDDDLVRFLARVSALRGFLEGEDGRNLVIAYRRAANIVRIEEKKDGRSFAEAPVAADLATAEETALSAALETAIAESAAKLAAEDFTAAMAALAALRAPVDAFFDKVTVNADDPKLRSNRLRLLSRIGAAMESVADFSRLEG
ncbi:glycine--tRNA ligase subunit beta [Oleispirillum naphthae]|uniref:glycine--tRNA ligase subunit beta n=1 Tax=Oleispirillum naphthae TaxID=2838853 RepID=UPI0030824D6F